VGFPHVNHLPGNEVFNAENRQKPGHYLTSCTSSQIYDRIHPMHDREAPVMLVTFDIYFDGEFWCARGMGVDIFTQGTTLDELMHNVKDAVELHFEETIDAGEQITVVSLTELQVGSIARISGC